MINQAAHRLLAIAALASVPICSFFANGALAAASHLVDYSDVAIEHAELVLGPEGIPDRAYLTIYNGTGTDLALSSVTIAGYREATVVRRTKRLVAFEETSVGDAYLVIPRKAELDMGPDTLFLSLNRLEGSPRNVTMTIRFDDGTSRTFSVKVLAAVSARTSHHHGASELE